MKKHFLIFVAFSLLMAGTLCPVYSNAKPSVSMTVSAIHGQSVTVYKITAHAVARTNGVYDSDSNTITVNGNTYRVYENPQYGRGGKTSSYRYMAGSDYYFNL